MVKISARQADAFVKSPDPNVHAFLVYGPDSGLVNERAYTLLSASGADLNDPFCAVTLRGDELAKQPTRLFDEASAISLGGGLRVVRAQGVSESVADSMANIFERSLENLFIVLEAGDLGPRSRLRRLFEGADGGAALPCYVDDDISRERIIEETLREEGKAIDGTALGYLSSHLGGDRGVARRELEKLLLYLSGEFGPITLQQTVDCIGDESEHVLNDVAVAAGSGRTSDLLRAYDRCVAAGQQDIAILRALSRHLQRLHAVSVARDAGAGVEKAMSDLRPPVFFRDKAGFADQVSKWTTVRLERALNITLNSERSCKSSGMPGDLICGRALFQIAAAARWD